MVEASEVRLCGKDSTVFVLDGAGTVLWCPANLNVFFTIRKAGTGAEIGGGNGSDSSSRDGSSTATGEVGGEGGAANTGGGTRAGVTAETVSDISQKQRRILTVTE